MGALLMVMPGHYKQPMWMMYKRPLLDGMGGTWGKPHQNKYEWLKELWEGKWMVRRQDLDMKTQKDSHRDKVHMDKELTGMSARNSRFDRSQPCLSLEPSRILICALYFVNYENNDSLYFTYILIILKKIHHIVCCLHKWASFASALGCWNILWKAVCSELYQESNKSGTQCAWELNRELTLLACPEGRTECWL